MTDETPDRVAATLAGIRERGYRNGATGAECARLSDAAAVDIRGLLAAVEAVLELHRPVGDGCAAGGCTWSWPCPTILAITRKITRKGAGGGT